MNRYDDQALRQGVSLTLRVREAVVVAASWIMAVLFPAIVSHRHSDFPDLGWVIIGGVFLFLAFDAIRSGSRLRIIVRAVVPAALLGISSAAYWIIWPLVATR